MTEDMNIFEHEVATELGQMAGPGRRIDAMAMVRTVSTQSPRWRLQSMFSATKFVVAGVIVALFGGFLLLSISVERPAENVPAAATIGPGTFGPAGSLGVWTGSVTPLPDGRVLVIGSLVTGFTVRDDLPPRAEVWDPATASFSPAGSLSQVRDHHTSVLLPDGRVLVVGGTGEFPGPFGHPGPEHPDVGLASAEVWNPVTGSFSPAGSLIEPQYAGRTDTPLPDGRVLIVGGSRGDGVDEGDTAVDHPDVGLASAVVWDPATESFSPAGSLSRGREGHSATLLADGRVLIAGGWGFEDGESGQYSYVAQAEVWDPATASFSPAGSFAQVRADHTTLLLKDGRVLVIGDGEDSGFGTAFAMAVEVWDPATASFEPAGSPGLDRGLRSLTATLLPDGHVLIVGDGESAEEWDPSTLSFEPAGSLGEGRAEHSATRLPDGRVLIVGGVRPPMGRTLASAEVWDPATRSFSPAASLETRRAGHVAVLLPDERVLVLGGVNDDDPSTRIPSAEIWSP